MTPSKPHPVFFSRNYICPACNHKGRGLKRSKGQPTKRCAACGALFERATGRILGTVKLTPSLKELTPWNC